MISWNSRLNLKARQYLIPLFKIFVLNQIYRCVIKPIPMPDKSFSEARIVRSKFHVESTNLLQDELLNKEFLLVTLGPKEGLVSLLNSPEVDSLLHKAVWALESDVPIIAGLPATNQREALLAYGSGDRNCSDKPMNSLNWVLATV